MDIRSMFHARALIFTSLILCRVSSGTVTITSGFSRRLLQQGDNVTLECRATGQFLVPMIWLLDGLPLRYVNPQLPNSIPRSADNPHEASADDTLRTKYAIATSKEISDDGSISSNDAVIDDGMTKSGKVVNVERRTNESSIIKVATVTPEAIRQPPRNENFRDIELSISQDVPITGARIATIRSSLSLMNAGVQDGGIYTCVARNSFGETASWREKIAVAGPLSLRQNRPMVALFDSLIIIPCTVLGTDDEPRVTWFYKENSDTVGDSSSSWISKTDVVGYTTHKNGSLEISRALKAHEGIYSCQVELNRVTETTETSVRVVVPPEVDPLLWMPVKVGIMHSKMCSATVGDPPLNLFWMKDGVTIRPSDHIEMLRSHMNPTLSLTIKSVTLQSAGNYSCCASNNVSTTCSTTSLVVLDPPKIVNLSSTVSTMSGRTVEIPCKVTGFPKPNVTWMRLKEQSANDYVTIPLQNGVATSKGNVDSAKITQTQHGSLLVVNASTPDAGKYRCQAENKVGKFEDFVSLQVHNPARILEITKTRDVIYRNDVIVECSVWGDDAVSVTWTKNGTVISDLDDRIRTTTRDGGLLDKRYPIIRSGLSITNTIRTDTALYTCHAKNKYGISKRNTNVIVRAPPLAPKAFAVSDRGTSFLRMMVSPGDDDGGKRLQKYQLTYRKVHQNIDIPVPSEDRLTPTIAPPMTTTQAAVTQFPLANGDVQEISLNELECGTEYEVSIRAINEIGTSFEAANLTASTVGAVPILPDENELVVAKNQTRIVLDLRTWQNGGCPITALWIEVARHGDTEWNMTKFDGSILEKALTADSVVGEGNEINPARFVLSGLQAGSWYKVWLSACNVAGCSGDMYSIGTYLPDGELPPPIGVDVKQATDMDDGRYLVPMICGFGLVILLVLMLLLYRYKQRAKKMKRLKAADKMARSLLNRPSDATSSPRGMIVAMPDITRTSTGSPFPDGSVSSGSVADDSVITMQFTDRAAGNAQTNDHEHEQLDELADLPVCKNVSATSQTRSSVCSERSKVSSEGKKSLKDNAELAVFRDMSCSDDENHVIEPLNCDESDFGDSGTWSFFKPVGVTDRTNFHKITAKTGGKPEPRRSSSSSGTDEEVARVFGMPCSKSEPKSEKERPMKSDVNDNYHPSPKSDHTSHNRSKPTVIPKKNQERLTVTRGKLPTLMQQEVRSNSTGLLQKSNPRHFRPVTNDATREPKRWNTAAHGKANQTFNITNHTPTNIHRPNHEHRRGNTYSNDSASNWKVQTNMPPSNNAITSSSPYGEREWVDTYDSRCSTNRSKPPSWGSIELDKQGYVTPPVDAYQIKECPRKNRDTSKYCTPDINPSTDNSVCDYPSKDGGRKLDTNSPRDSGIGSDDGPASRHMTSSISPPTMKARNAQKSLESLDETDLKRGDHSNPYCGVKVVPNALQESLYLMSPPLTPPIHQAKLAPHIFVDLSSKSNTTPTRNPRSSYPPCGQNPPNSGHCNVTQPKRIDCYPTPPPSGSNTPVDVKSRSKSKRQKDCWAVADLDKRITPETSRLLGDKNTAPKDTTYSISKKDRTWQASTLV